MKSHSWLLNIYKSPATRVEEELEKKEHPYVIGVALEPVQAGDLIKVVPYGFVKVRTSGF